MSAYRLSRGVGDLRRVGDLRMDVVLRAAFTIFAIYLLGGGPLSLTPGGVSLDDAGMPAADPTSGSGGVAADVLVKFAPIYLVTFLLAVRRYQSLWRVLTAD